MKHFHEQSKSWESPLVQGFEYAYSEQKDIFRKIDFIIDVFFEYREDHSFGEYDPFVMIDDETLSERDELSNFLTNKFSAIQNELREERGNTNQLTDFK